MPYDEETTSVELSYSKEKPYLIKLLNEWKSEIDDTTERREVRFVEFDVEDLQRRELLQQDETFIPIRVINTNISREEPLYVRYLKGARRIAVFESIDKPSQNVEQLETEFTRGMTYPGYEIPLLKVRDGAATHGWDAVEIEFDESRPFHVNIAHIGRENLIVPLNFTSIESCGCIMRRFCITLISLDELVEEHDFNDEQVSKLRAALKAKKDSDTEVYIYKVFKKVDGVVRVTWAALEEACDDWLGSPEKLFRGRMKRGNVEKTVKVPGTSLDKEGNLIATEVETTQLQEEWIPIDEITYPIKLLPYSLTEQPKIMDIRGRVFLDEEKQEAQTALWSAFVNGAVRASNVYASPDVADNGIVKQLDLKLEPGIYSQKLNFWGPPYPDIALLNGAGILDAKTQEESGQIAYSVTARKDSRKTAREVEEASSKSTELSSVQLVLFSLFFQSVLEDAWTIVQSQALQGLITFLPIVTPGGEPLNDIAVIGQRYHIKPAGDIDVVRREEKRQKRKALWPLVAQTPLALPFLLDIIKDDLPDDAPRYEQILLGAPNPKDQAIQSLLSLVNGLESGNPDAADNKDQIDQIKQFAVQSLQSNGLNNQAVPAAEMGSEK